MVDRSFTDPSLAALYDSLNPWGPGDDFCLGQVMSAGTVLDIGCGTGRLLGRARREGHRGRLMGLDPAAAMLVRARAHEPGVEWVLGDLRSREWHGEFELAVMTGHAFQVLLGDEELRLALAAVRAALAPGGRFVFETRNPGARAWERWTPDRVREIPDGDGGVVRVWHEVESVAAGGERVTFTETFEGARWARPQVDRTTLRFLGADALDRFLRGAGFVVVERYGDWGRGPLTVAAPEIVTVAEPADRHNWAP
ncbi:class I SAM-dependent methyltransferase [Streptomyces sp. MBT53]|uniref:class I SAM-dependent methyltransferase n=1 Tax=Streptomyces sp. MBT53 TaxID=1488384 RepID=UPI0027DAADDC|nr:class I SAM-dependent methyltransferase [Streptomyces sp. MBT53]